MDHSLKANSWGNGTTSSGTLGADQVSATGSHTHDSPGVYRVGGTVTDDDGGVGEKIHECVVVAGDKAMFKSVGSVNGEAGYRFLISAINGPSGGGSDKFRIKIWETDSGASAYDNALGAAENAGPTTLISGGSITVHTPKGRK